MQKTILRYVLNMSRICFLIEAPAVKKLKRHFKISSETRETRYRIRMGEFSIIYPLRVTRADILT